MATKSKRLKVSFLGGTDEIGKNMTAYEYGEDIVVVDCGSIFPEEEMLGIDLVIPDIAYLIKNQHRIRAFFITHGHEDHIGAVPYVLKQLSTKIPIYGTRLTLALIENKLKEHGIQNANLRVIKPKDHVTAGVFTAQFIKMSHSITGAVSIALHTPVGIVIHTGDFKLDYTPVDGEVMDLATLSALGNKGVLALLCDSTNAEKEGYTMSERRVGETLKSLFRDATGRIIVASFASNIHRVQQIVDAAISYNRKVALAGRSMINVANVAMKLGELHIPEDKLVELDRVRQQKDDEIVIITTGSQGEPMSGLARMSTSEHAQVEIKEGDMVIISANPIPGNEKYVNRVINGLLRRGANVIYESLAEVHTSGHATREELKLIHSLVKPKFFVPVHGEFRHMRAHAQLAESLGMPKERIFIPDNGATVELGRNSAKLVRDAIPTGSVLVDGLGIGDVGNVVLKDRKLLSEDGLVIVSVVLSKQTGKLLAPPEILSRGFVFVRESDKMMNEARNIVRNLFEKEKVALDNGSLKMTIKAKLKNYLSGKTKRNPMILPIVTEI